MLKFKDINTGDRLYYISPNSLTIKAVVVVKITGHAVKGIILREHLKFQVVPDLSYIHSKLTSEFIAETLEDTDKVFPTLVLPTNTDNCLLNQEAPTMMATSAELLEKFIGL